MVRSAVGSASRRSSGIGWPLSTERPYVPAARRELVLVEIGSLIPGIVRIRRISGVLVGSLRKRTLDPLALRGQELTCPLRIHRPSLLQVVLDDGLVTRLSCVRVESVLFQGAPLAQEIPAFVE